MNSKSCRSREHGIHRHRIRANGRTFRCLDLGGSVLRISLVRRMGATIQPLSSSTLDHQNECRERPKPGLDLVALKTPPAQAMARRSMSPESLISSAPLLSDDMPDIRRWAEGKACSTSTYPGNSGRSAGATADLRTTTAFVEGSDDPLRQ